MRLLLSIFVVLITQNTLAQRKGNLHENCSEFVGGKVGEVDYFVQLCYDSTFYYQEWNANGYEIIDEGYWWYNRSDRTVVMNSEEIPRWSHAFYDAGIGKAFMFDSIPFKFTMGMLYLFEEDYDTLEMHMQIEYRKRILYYVIPKEIDEEEVAYQKSVDSVRRLGPFHQNKYYAHLFLTEDKGIYGWMTKKKAKKEAKKNEKEARKVTRLTEKERKEKAKDEEYVKKQEEKHRKKQTRLEYIQEKLKEQEERKQEEN